MRGEQEQSPIGRTRLASSHFSSMSVLSHTLSPHGAASFRRPAALPPIFHPFSADANGSDTSTIVTRMMYIFSSFNLVCWFLASSSSAQPPISGGGPHAQTRAGTGCRPRELQHVVSPPPKSDHLASRPSRALLTGTLDVPDDATALVVHELDADLGNTTARAGTAEDAGHLDQLHGLLGGFHFELLVAGGQLRTSGGEAESKFPQCCLRLRFESVRRDETAWVVGDGVRGGWIAGEREVRKKKAGSLVFPRFLSAVYQFRTKKRFVGGRAHFGS